MYNAKKCNYLQGFLGWHIVATCEIDGFQIGLTADGLIKDCKKIVGDSFIDCECPREIHLKVDSYNSGLWEEIIESAV